MRVCIPALAWLGALFSTLGALLWTASDACVDRGGRSSDSAWVCEFPGREAESLWSYVGWFEAGLATLLVGLPVLLLVRRLGRRRNACATPGPADTSPGSR